MPKYKEAEYRYSLTQTEHRHQMRLGGQRHAPADLAELRSPDKHCTVSWVVLRTALNWCGAQKIPCSRRGSNP